MLISSLYHTQGIVGYNYQKTERTKDTEMYYLHSKARRLACPQCRSWNTPIGETGKTRDIRGLSIGLKNDNAGRYPSYKMQRLLCVEPWVHEYFTSDKCIHH